MIGGRKIEDSELNGSKHCPNLICSLLIHEFNFDLLLSSDTVILKDRT
jgi:hypothetical protein